MKPSTMHASIETENSSSAFVIIVVLIVIVQSD